MTHPAKVLLKFTIEALNYPVISNLNSYLSAPQEACPGNTMLQILKSGMNPDQLITPRCLKDPMLVSINVGVGPEGCLDTIGIASLDTRILAGSSTEDSITTSLLLLRRRSIPSNKRTRQYLFGAPEHAPPETARDILHKTLRQVDKEHGGLRNVVLVGHDIKKDMRFLKDTLGFSIASIPSIVAIIDTQQLARQVFSFRHKCVSLHRTLSALGINARQLHNSGNDAVYILKALIYLFCSYQADAIDQSRLCVRPLHHQQDVLVEPLWRQRLDRLRQIALGCPRPIRPREAVRAGRQLRAPRVENPDLFEIETNDDGETEDSMIGIFGDDP